MKRLIQVEALAGQSKWGRGLLQGLGWIVEPLLRFEAYNRAYSDFLGSDDGSSNFFESSLASLAICLRIREEDLDRIPETGPVFLVANHPFGGVDGLALGAMLLRIRPEGKLLVNGLLQRVDPLKKHIIGVDPFGGENAQRSNLAGMRAAIRELRNGGLLATFPAGEVSSFHWKKGKVIDGQWAENIAGLIRKTEATVVPVYFPGRNSLFFQMAGLIHPRLRTALLPRAVLSQKNRELEIRVGNPIPWRRLANCATDRDRMDVLRLRTYILQNREAAEKTSFFKFPRRASKGKDIIEARDKAELECEVESLPPEALLAEQGEFAVYVTSADQAPTILLELGRLREITFRAVGEGTGTDCDLDRFDRNYLHIFMWHRERREIVGAYRMGLADVILGEHGKSGLYTSTLFRFKRGIIEGLGPSMELGRSFVIKEYQRKPVSLSLMWRGIGEYVARNPQYKILFGPVTISREYQGLSKNLMVTYLREHTLDKELARQVKAKKPPRSQFFGSLDRTSFKRSIRDIEDVSALISEIEREERGVPVLLRQYLKLNATMLSFNVDPDFNDCIDGLVLVDLTRAPERILQRYLGRRGAASFLEWHGVDPIPEPSSKKESELSAR